MRITNEKFISDTKFSKNATTEKEVKVIYQ